MSKTLNIEGAKSMSGSLIAGSEEDFDTVCEFCHGEGKRVEAVGYCVDCKEYLCKDCKSNHKKTSATKNHVLKDNLDMSTKIEGAKRAQRSSDATDPLTDRCKKHPDELIKLYCNSHNQLACPICISLQHRTCDDISYIRDVSCGIADSEELKNILVDLKKLISISECGKSRSKWSQREADDSYNQMVTEVKQFKQKINQLCDKLEEELLSKASLLKQEHLDSLSDQALKCDDLRDKLTEINSDLENKLGQKHYNQLFISMKSAKESIPVLEKETGSISQLIRTQRFVFRRDEKLDKMTSSITRLGTVSLDDKSDNVRAKYLHDINVKSDTDTKHCNISGAAVLPDGRLALSDFNNKSVKLVDVASRKISEEMSLTTAPRDMALVGDDQLAVLLKKQDYIQVLSLSPTLSASHTIAMPGKYNGITYSEGKLILACYTPSSVHICDMSGNLLQKIATDNTGNELFTAPSRLTTSPDQSIIYVTDYKGNKTICLNKAGVVMATYVNDRLKYPVGVTVDDYGNVYICSQDTHTIHQLSPSGQLIQVILEERDGIKCPRAITHSAGKLYISSASTAPALANNIKVYKLEQD